MNANKAALVALLAWAPLVATGAAAPATIGELSDMARDKKIAEQSMPAAPAVRIGAAGAMPPGMAIVPSTSILSGAPGPAAAANAVPKSVKPEPAPDVVPEVLVIVKAPDGTRYVELSDGGRAGRFAAGQVTASGWTVMTVGARHVELSRAQSANRPARRLTLPLTNQGARHAQ